MVACPLFLFCPAMDWRFIQGVPRLLPINSRRQAPVFLRQVADKQYRKWMYENRFSRFASCVWKALDGYEDCGQILICWEEGLNPTSAKRKKVKLVTLISKLNFQLCYWATSSIWSWGLLLSQWWCILSYIGSPHLYFFSHCDICLTIFLHKQQWNS